MYLKRSDDRLINQVEGSIFEYGVMIFGNWNEPHAKFHEPVPGKHFRRLIEKPISSPYSLSATSEPLLFSNLQTSSRESPGPSRTSTLETRPMTTACSPSKVSKSELLHRQPSKFAVKWNRDTLATLNFQHILQGLRQSTQRPAHFSQWNNTLQQPPWTFTAISTRY